MVLLSPIHVVKTRDSGEASFLSMPDTSSHTTPHVIIPTKYRASDLERYNDPFHHTSIERFSTLLRVYSPGYFCMRGKDYLPSISGLLDGVRSSKLDPNHLREVL